MENEDDDLCVEEDEDEQCTRNPRKVKMNAIGEDNCHNTWKDKDNVATETSIQTDNFPVRNYRQGNHENRFHLLQKTCS